jgi:Fe-S cluster assembly ATP-binding protein
MLEVKNLDVKAGRKQILFNVNLSVADGEICCVMGSNGSGKSTLLNALMGNPAYKLKSDAFEINGVDCKNLEADQKSMLGLFLSYQSPPEFPEMSGAECLKMISEVKEGKGFSQEKFLADLESYCETLLISPEMLNRPLNEGFSGGERKRMEILQMMFCKPAYVMLDEIDTGLDVDSLILIGNTLKAYVEKHRATVVLVTHYFRFLEYLTPTKVVVLQEGKVSVVGDYSLAEKIDKQGYSFLKN